MTLLFTRKTVAATLLCVAGAMGTQAFAADETNASEGIDYRPEIHGTLRTRYEMNVEDDAARFQVRAARVSFEGKVAPTIDYYVQADFDVRGEFSFLDAWGRVALSDKVKVSLGQMRVPFSVGASRAPHLYYFANRSTVGKLVGRQRGVGCKVAVGSFGGLTAEAGVFNTATITRQQVWEHSVDAACKARYTVGNMFFEGGFESVMPDSIRINQYDACVHWQSGRWMVEGEYLYKHYECPNFKPTHAWNVMGNYEMPVKVGTFNRLSFQTRYDGITDNSQGVRDEEGELFPTTKRFQRVTVGTTLSYVHKKVRADVRLNYENYFFPSGYVAPIGERDKVLAELIIRF